MLYYELQHTDLISGPAISFTPNFRAIYVFPIVEREFNFIVYL